MDGGMANGKYRHLTSSEVVTLVHGGNFSSDPEWGNVLVSCGGFDAALVHNSEFRGQVMLGALNSDILKFHDLELPCGIYRSCLKDVVTGDYPAIHNVTYLVNYRLGNRVMLFNVQEMSATDHAKFGAGDHWIEICNENGGRAVLPFREMITADAYLWSHYKDDKALMDALITMTSFDAAPSMLPGTVGDEAVIKNTTLIKDADIGAAAYIKGAFKLKNITVLSSKEEPSQIGEGVEMVNGIMGYASHVFYQAVAVRFVIGRNCQLKYGARLLNSVLGDNSTVSCCELLNNLIFPFHEQHHNSSFLIASTIGGQSNIAAGATVGSNHNSRSPDGEIAAHRGFWPGLCSDFKHNSRFASFVLASKGSYQHELDIIYPFSLIAPADSVEKDSAIIKAHPLAITITPAWYFIHDMFAIVRNKYKFLSRDKRKIKIQHIETDPIAPDTLQEIIKALERIISLTAKSRKKSSPSLAGEDYNAVSSPDELQAAKDYLHHTAEDNPLFDITAQKKYGAVILKSVKAYKMYRAVLKYFAAREIARCGKGESIASMLLDIKSSRLCTSWVNAGGQIIAEEDIDILRAKIRTGEISTWQEVHGYYDKCQKEYGALKARYAVYLLEYLYSRPVDEFTPAVYGDIVKDVIAISNTMYRSSLSSRKKDFTDYYRKMTYRNDEEMKAVLGSADGNPFLVALKEDTNMFNESVKKVFSL